MKRPQRLDLKELLTGVPSVRVERHCERTPPPGWPGERCKKNAVYSVGYQLAEWTKIDDLKVIEVCLEHLGEMKLAETKGILRDLDVRDVRDVRI